jgi:hypothetical protein
LVQIIGSIVATVVKMLKSSVKRISVGGWLLIVVLLGLLFFSFLIGYVGWKSAGDTDVPSSGYIVMALGVVFSLLVGVGLMGLVFYSSRNGYDKPAEIVKEQPDKGP